MIRMLVFATLCFFGLGAPAWAAAIQIDDLQAHVDNTENRLEVFMVISNTSAATDTLYAVKSKAAATTRLSVSSEEEERALESAGQEGKEAIAIEVRPNEPVTLHEEGTHIEMRGLKSPLKEGEVVALTLFFENAGPVKVKATIVEEEE